ncbi:hypothetical protein [Vibrio sp.]|uniref:hypothetical protein n=1 Tax=Vibrio sp. TaxID=678 RepID=UPI003D0FEA37
MFNRQKPDEFDQAIALPDRDCGTSLLIVRLNNRMIGKTGTKYRRRTPVIISNQDNNHWVLRYCMGGSSLKGLTKSSLAIDYDGVDELGIRFKQPASLIMRRANVFDMAKWYWAHPDRAVRAEWRFVLIGFALSVGDALNNLISAILQ